MLRSKPCGCSPGWWRFYNLPSGSFHIYYMSQWSWGIFTICPNMHIVACWGMMVKMFLQKRTRRKETTKASETYTFIRIFLCNVPSIITSVLFGFLNVQCQEYHRDVWDNTVCSRSCECVGCSAAQLLFVLILIKYCKIGLTCISLITHIH